MPYQCQNRPPSAQRASTSNDWLTPPSLLAALGALVPSGLSGDDWKLSRDPFDLDPCASDRQPWPTARTMLTRAEDGPSHVWKGEVWLNPPYGSELYSWLALLARHGNGTALLYARTDTQGFQNHVWREATAVFFITGRLFFHKPVTGYQAQQNCGGPMCLACYGPKSLARVSRLMEPDSNYPGILVTPTRSKR